MSTDTTASNPLLANVEINTTSYHPEAPAAALSTPWGAGPVAEVCARYSRFGMELSTRPPRENNPPKSGRKL